MPTPRTGHTSSVVNNKIYVIGGWNGSEKLKTVSEYDPLTDIWTEKASMPSSLCFLKSSVVNEKIYTVGGWNWESELSSNSVSEYSPKTDTWIEKTPMLSPRSEAGCCQIDGKIYVISGFNHGIWLNSVEVYNPTNDDE
ncbi:MAG: hypothetical protein PF517_16910 [Salinivirgaceae bacterium]|jgi:N-acetylneuraminic acid mutarotase|nr:hypothetical protein [Salinivirgaceae bacterium]